MYKSARTLDIEIKGSRLIIFTQKFLQGFHFLYRSFKVKWNTVGVGAKNDFMGEINFGFAFDAVLAIVTKILKTCFLWKRQ